MQRAAQWPPLTLRFKTWPGVPLGEAMYHLLVPADLSRKFTKKSVMTLGRTDQPAKVASEPASMLLHCAGWRGRRHQLAVPLSLRPGSAIIPAAQWASAHRRKSSNTLAPRTSEMDYRALMTPLPTSGTGHASSSRVLASCAHA